MWFKILKNSKEFINYWKIKSKAIFINLRIINFILKTFEVGNSKILIITIKNIETKALKSNE